MAALFDQHCQIVTVRRRANKKTPPWLDTDCRAARRRARTAERRFKRTSSDADYRAWSAELSKMRELYEEKNSTFWRSEIDTCHGNTQRLWQSLLGEPASDDTGAHKSQIKYDVQISNHFAQQIIFRHTSNRMSNRIRRARFTLVVAVSKRRK